MKSEDQDLTCSEKTDLNSQFSELPTEPVKEDTEPFSKPTDQILSSNDVSCYLIILIFFLSYMFHINTFSKFQRKSFSLYYYEFETDKSHFENLNQLFYGFKLKIMSFCK